jgi:hypothetical protein
VLTGVTGFSGEIVVDSHTRKLVEMPISSGDTIGSFKLVAWEDQDLKNKYGEDDGGIPAYPWISLVFISLGSLRFLMRKNHKN